MPPANGNAPISEGGSDNHVGYHSDNRGQFTTAKEWQRAAIVYAFTYEGTGGPSGNRNAGENSSALTVSEFAVLGVKGLATRDSVRNYRKNWEWAIDGDRGA